MGYFPGGGYWPGLFSRGGYWPGGGGYFPSGLFSRVAVGRGLLAGWGLLSKGGIFRVAIAQRGGGENNRIPGKTHTAEIMFN